LAHSRPPPLTHSAAAASPPPLSPRTHHSEKKSHHSRRKSGKDYVAAEKKASRPAPLSRKSTPQHNTRTVSGWSSGRSSTRDRDSQEESARDSGESFPQFCMTCEKQFLPANNTFLYCSETCRLHDQTPTGRTSSYPATPSSPPLTPYSRHFSSLPGSTPDEGPDIIPRFSPTQSRPRSYFNSDPYPASYQPPTYSTPPKHDRSNRNSTALASLRELATALPKSSRNGEPESPPKSSASSMSRTGSGVWNYMPFTSNSKNSTPTPSATPGNSYGNGTYSVSQSYGGAATSGRSREDLYNYGRSHSNFGSTGGMGMDRPLPPRSGPGGYGHRPRSIDLVTPVSGGAY
ncbi:hypothetical protein B0J14DRAFT_492931, partial [Halenospora varia]